MLKHPNSRLLCQGSFPPKLKNEDKKTHFSQNSRDSVCLRIGDRKRKVYLRNGDRKINWFPNMGTRKENVSQKWFSKDHYFTKQDNFY